jgi:ABC-type nitrate/sulfonate/bicarbonate transport system substrate-binding protein
MPATSRRGVLRAIAGVGSVMAAGTVAAPRAARAAGSLRVQGIWTNDPESIGYFIGIDEGDYSRAGLAVTYLPGGPELIPEGSLLTGKADVALLSTINAAQAVYRKGVSFRIIGAQYQKNPDAIISLATSNIRTPADLKGKIVACPPLNLLTFRAMLRLAGVPAASVRIVPYNFDPTPLVTGTVDAVVDYMMLLPWVVEHNGGKKAAYFMLSDAGMPLFSNVVAVTGETLATRRTDLAGFLHASRDAWTRNFKDPDLYPTRYQDSWFKSAGLSLEAMKAQNRAQEVLMTNPAGFFAMSPHDVAQNIQTLKTLGIPAGPELFDTTLLPAS